MLPLANYIRPDGLMGHEITIVVSEVILLALELDLPHLKTTKITTTKTLEKTNQTDLLRRYPEEAQETLR